MAFNEEKLEQAIIDLVGDQGYPHMTGAALAREPQEVLTGVDLEAHFRERYSAETITNDDFRATVRKLENYSSAYLRGSNLPKVRRPDDSQPTKGDAPDTAQMNALVREMITEAHRSDGVEEIIKMGEGSDGEVNLFDDDYLARIEKIKLPNTKIKLLQQLLAKAISDFRKVNRAKGIDFSKQLQRLVEKYNERDDANLYRGEVADDIIDNIIDRYMALIEKLKAEIGSYADLDIDLEAKSFLRYSQQLDAQVRLQLPGRQAQGPRESRKIRGRRQSQIHVLEQAG